MRISDAAWLVLGLAGCSAGAPVADGEVIDCALASAASFTHDCTVERSTLDGEVLLIVHHPDGGFRRFRVVEGGLEAADGAQALAIARNADRIDISIDGDRYRFPATMPSDDHAR